MSKRALAFDSDSDEETCVVVPKESAVALPALSSDDESSVTCVPCAEQPRVFACDLCEYKAKEAGHLKRHKANKHYIGVVWHVCNQTGCDFKAKEQGSLKRHKAFKHDIGVVWHVCDHPGCEHKAKEAGHLKRHKANKHDIGVVWHVCDHPGCEHKAKEAGHLKHHKALKHDIGVVWVYCDHPKCEYRTKQADTLKKHKADRHDIGVVWHVCDQPGCEHKAKQAINLKRHKANVHDIGVVWHTCDADPGKCDYQSKQLGNLYDHIRRMHARVYAQRKKEQEERVRRALLDADWKEWRLAESMPPVGYFRREKRIDFKCAKLATDGKNARIDFVLGVPNGFVFLEVDEQQHKYGYGGLVSCDMKRMSHVMESLAVETDCNLPCIYWLRYNPHAWHVDGALRRMPKVEREVRLVAWLEAFEAVAPLRVGYAFYDCEGGALDVLDNPEYNEEFKEVVDNLMDLTVVE